MAACWLVTTGHNTGNTLNVNFLSNISGLDDLLLVADGHKPVLASLPAVLLHPVVDRGVLDEPQKFPDHPHLDRLSSRNSILTADEGKAKLLVSSKPSKQKQNLNQTENYLPLGRRLLLSVARYPLRMYWFLS